jgi:hypothetical protein
MQYVLNEVVEVMGVMRVANLANSEANIEDRAESRTPSLPSPAPLRYLSSAQASATLHENK